MAACAEPITVESDEEKLPSPRKGRGGRKRSRNQAASASQKRGGKQSGAQEVVNLEQDEEPVPSTVPADLEAQAKEEWACATCTYLNDVALDKCSMCQELRYKAGGPSSSLHPAAPSPAGKDATHLSVASEQEAASTRGGVCPHLDSKCKHCEEEFPADKLCSLDLCEHRFCQACLEGHVKERMAERPAAEEAKVADVLSSLVCSYSSCGRPLSRRDVTGIAGVKEVAEYDAWLAPLLRRLLMSGDANSSTLLCQQEGCQANGLTCHNVIGLKSLPIVQVRAVLRLRGLETKGRAADCVKRLQAAVGLLTNSSEWHICTKCGCVYCSTCLAKLSPSPEIVPLGRHLCPQEQVLLAARHLAALEGAYQALCGPASPPAKGDAERSLEKLRDLAKGRKRAKVALPQRAPGGSGTVWAKGTGFGGVGNDRWGYTPPAAAGPSKAELAAQAAERKADDALRSAAEGLTGCLSGAIALAAGGGVMPAVSLPACSLLLSGSLARILRTLLHNDSLMDVSGRRDLYVALLQLLRTLASHADLLPLLCQPPPAEDRAPPGGASAVVQQEEEVVLAGLEKLYQQAKFLLQSAMSGVEDDADGLDVGLACEVRDVHEVVQGSTERWLALQPAKEPLPAGPAHAAKDKPEAEQLSASQPRARTRRAAKAEAEAKGDKGKGKGKVEEAPAVNLAAEAAAYKAALKPLQFAMCDLKGSSGQYDHYFRGELDKAIDKAGVHAQKRMLRVSKELASLATTLPLEWESSIHLRVDQERMDLLKALIIGPHDTPYANGLFMFDIFLPPDYPNSSPKVHFLTTGGGTVRFNPNLYHCGKVCLSLLGTWSGPGWDPGKSTLLQVLVSIQSLIFVQDPYYNEPGYEAHGQSSASEEYNAAQRRNTLQFAILPALKTPTPVFKDVLERHFRMKKRELSRQCEEWAAIKPPARPKPPKQTQDYSMGFPMPFNHMLGTSSSKDSIADAAKAVKAELAKVD